MKRKISEIIALVGGRRNALTGMIEGLPFVAFIAVLYLLAMLSPRYPV